MNELKFNISAAKDSIIYPELPANKSIVNRLLIIASLSKNKFEFSQAKASNDVLILKRILNSTSDKINVEDAGTAARFALSWACLQNRVIEIFGTERMHQRPMKALIDALRAIGFSIKCLDNEGYLPVRIQPNSEIKKANIIIDSSLSSQFISSLCLIAPYLEKGLNIKLIGKKASWPYIEMTLKMLKSAGVDVKNDQTTIQIKRAESIIPNFKIEFDWSAAAFWFQISSLLPNQKFIIKNLSLNSIQGDKEVATLFEQLGVRSISKENQIEFQKVKAANSNIKIDFTDFPDLAQPFICACVLSGVDGEFYVLKNLKIKETDRIQALKNELEKTGAELIISSDKILLKSPRTISNSLSFSTYSDHRMAMALAPFALRSNFVKMDNTEVVKKSYPFFWQELEKLGITLQA